MPSSSRKKNKGKDRKAKKEEAQQMRIYNDWQAWVQGQDIGQRVPIQCNHGLVIDKLPDKSHPVSSFITAFFQCDGVKDWRDTVQKHNEVWNNDEYRKLARDILVKIYANWMICKLDNIEDAIEVILVLEKYGETRDYDLAINSRDVLTKYRDISCWVSERNDRDYLKFYRKRITCKCLKKMHLEARKAEPKLGECIGCGTIKERALLMVCSRCMVHQYCSRKCQVAALPRHREACDMYTKAHRANLHNSNMD